MDKGSLPKEWFQLIKMLGRAWPKRAKSEGQCVGGREKKDNQREFSKQG